MYRVNGEVCAKWSPSHKGPWNIKSGVIFKSFVNNLHLILTYGLASHDTKNKISDLWLTVKSVKTTWRHCISGVNCRHMIIHRARSAIWYQIALGVPHGVIFWRNWDNDNHQWFLWVRKPQFDFDDSDKSGVKWLIFFYNNVTWRKKYVHK